MGLCQGAMRSFSIDPMDACLFADCSISAIHVTCLPSGKPSGGAYVEFSSAVHRKKALQLLFDKPVSRNIKGELHVVCYESCIRWLIVRYPAAA